MKPLFIVSALLLGLMAAGSAHADEASLGGQKYGLQFGLPTGAASSVAGKYFLSDTTAVRGELGLGFQTEKKSKGQASGYGIKLGVHYQNYMPKGRIAPYWLAGITLAQNGGDANKGNDDLQLAISGGMGVEYFIDKAFSLSGEALLLAPLSPTVKVGTAMAGLYANFYF